jgi:hypothetical protein
VAEEYTPTEHIIRERYWLATIDDSGFPGVEEYADRHRAEFNRWLAEVKRDVWDEVADYHDRTNAPDIAESTRRDNPYRSEQT